MNYGGVAHRSKAFLGRNPIDAIIHFLWRRRTLFLTLIPLVLLILARPSPRLFWMGLPFIVAGQAIRIWSAGYLLKLHSLVTAGPFALCRNPIYIGSFVGSLGYFIMCGWLYVGAAAAVLFWVFHGGAVLYEEKLLRDRYGEEFDAYCRETGRFVPRSWSLTGCGAFSWKMVRYNREYVSALGVLILVVIFGVISYRPELAPAAWLFRWR